MIKKLREPFKVVETREVEGKVLKSIKAADVIDRLNSVLGLSWSFIIDSWFKEQDFVIVKGKLKITNDNTITEREAFGGASLSFVNNDFGNAFKAACSDALKKAASLFGVGLDLYLNTEESSQEIEEKTIEIGRETKSVEDDEAPFDSEDIEFPSIQSDDLDMISAVQKKAILNSQKIYGGNVEDYIFDCLNVRKKLDELTYDEAVKVIRSISERSKKK